MMYDLSMQTILIFAAFIIVVFVLYKLFRVLMKAALVAAAGFSFPWILNYLNIPLGIVASIDTGINFAMMAVGLFLVYEFFHFIVYFIKVLAWPFKSLVRKK